MNFFVTGTGTDVGKTYIAACLCSLLKSRGSTAYFKPAMSGNSRDEQGHLIPGDAQYVIRSAGLNQSLSSACPFVYEAALSPHLAAELEGRPFDLSLVLEAYGQLQKEYEHLVIEGAGGVLCPFSRDVMTLDVMKAFDAPLVVVADAGLGVLNALGLTAFWLKNHRLKVAGFVLNRFCPQDPMHQDNLRMLEAHLPFPLLGVVEEQSAFQPTPYFEEVLSS